MSSVVARPRAQFLIKAGVWAFLIFVVQVFSTVFLMVPLLLPALGLAGAVQLGFLDRTVALPRLFKVAVAAVFLAFTVWMSWPSAPEAHLSWEPYSDAKLVAAREAGKPVVIDFYADWCGPCRRMDSVVFTRKIVADAAEGYVLLRADVTENDTAQAQAVGSTFQVGALPTVVFIGKDGQERADLRLTGLESPSAFAERLRKGKS